MTRIPDLPQENATAVHRDAVFGVVLVGHMGAGKTSVGRALSRLLNWPFEDLDDRIQAREKRSIEQIFREDGEQCFRQAESVALRELCAELGTSPKVIALGGGAFVQPANAQLLKEKGVCTVFLDAPAGELLRRCQQENLARPLCRDAVQFRQLYDARRPKYMTATYRVETQGKDVDMVAMEVACSLGLK